MPVINRILNGKLNLDVSNYAVPPADYIDALNVTRDSEGESQDKIISNITGNVLVSFTLPSGTNKVVGSYADIVRNRIYYHIWNSLGNNLWVYYDANTVSITKLIQDLADTGSIPVLNYNPSKRINHIDIIYRDDDGDLYFWTDGYNTPKCANVTRIIQGDYTVVKSSFIETAKKPFLTVPTCLYGTDSTRGSNSLRKKLFQFSARPVYDDFQKATFSSYSKIPLPIGYYGSDNDTDSTKNNFITVTIETGDENVAKLEIFMRYNNGNVWSDFGLIASIDKEQFSVPDNSVYSFLFYNDGVYPTVAIDDAVRLFDYVPQLADGQVMANGNTPVYGAITEGYDPYPQGLLDVTLTAENVTNSPPDAHPPTLTYTSDGSIWTFRAAGVIPTGTVFQILANLPGTGPSLLSSYTSLVGDVPNDVAAGLGAYTLSHFPTYYFDVALADFLVKPPVPGFSVLDVRVTLTGGGGSSISTEKTWLWSANYIFGLVYVDEQNRDMPGVTNFISNTNTDNDFSVTTPAFSLVGADVQTPVISATINHLPPVGAVRYYWVRRRQTYGDFLFFETCDFQTEDGYYYLCLGNIAGYKANNTQFKYGAIPISEDSRIKVIASAGTGYGGNIWTQDYQVLGVVTRTMTGGTSPGDDREFVKVKIPTVVPSPAYNPTMLIMMYTPIPPPVTDTDSVYYEWGESYGIYNIAGVNYHRGKDQDQTASQPATFTWPEGDVYFHVRTMYKNRFFDDDAIDNDTLALMDAGFSDFFDSSVNDNGRPQIVDVNAKKQFNPVLVRFGHSFEAGSNINDTNRFDFLDFDEYDRARGIIRKMFLDKRRMLVLQQFDVGIVPVLTQIIRDTAGNPLEANSDKLLNKITYPYIGKFGIGDVPESFAYGKGASYFIDNNKAVVCRLSQDGITPISILYECNAYFIKQLNAYGKELDTGVVPAGQVYAGNPTAYGVFDAYTNKYIIAMEVINRYVDFNYSLAIAVPNRVVRFNGNVQPGVKVTLNISAANGETLSVNYTAVLGDTRFKVAVALNVLINATSLFSGVVNNYMTFTGAPIVGSHGQYPGISVHNHASSQVTIAVTVENLLYFHQDPATITFNETRGSDEGFESFLSFFPENMVALNNLLVTFKSGQFWRHDGPLYSNFYGVQYQASITPCFNDNPLIRKEFERISYRGNKIWVSDTNGDILTSIVNPQTNLPQISKLFSHNYEIDEGTRYAAFLRDINSKSVALEGLYEGDLLIADWLQIKLKYGGSDYAFIYIPHIGFKISPKTS